jgi:arsenate reductase
MVIIYHNPRCAKSREGLRYLTDKGYKHKIVLYLNQALHADQLKMLLMKLNLKPWQVVRTQEAIYRKDLKNKKFTEEEWINIIIENPRLLQRPVVEGRYKAVIAIPASKCEEIIDK